MNSQFVKEFIEDAQKNNWGIVLYFGERFFQYPANGCLKAIDKITILDSDCIKLELKNRTTDVFSLKYLTGISTWKS